MTTAWSDGRPAPAAALQALALTNYGHFTTMQVRAGAVQGLDLHLARLREATRELFGRDLDPERLRSGWRGALAAAGAADCTLRSTVFLTGADPLQRETGDASVQVLDAVSPAREPDATALRVRSCRHVRAAPHLKHVGTFALFLHRRLALREGLDDALFVDDQGTVLEGTLWNLGFLEAEGVIWPRGPALRGIAERLLQAGLAAAGVPQATRPVGLRELAGFRGAFACNARGVQAIGAIDQVRFPAGADAARLPREVMERQPWQPL
ncbi:aminotransferase class IV [Luteimonas sp. RD2P54]|uniref:Aminotransferase class IV n=1 Tax=Luteimonas endophytica TaxID=3042023 RepID=A0ABT6JC84_9GAMM|nr:aminotransferase class IV [Luteimonas endophytica]MDH5824180.1 aminotransferase class IV [Luteimonas endophytica]